MSLEARIESLEVAIVKLTDIIANGTGLNVSTSAAAGDEKGAAKTTGKTTGKTTTTVKAEEKKAEPKPEPKYSLEQLKALLQDYKAAFGAPAAKKLLPGMGYENSNAVPADKLDEVYAAVEAEMTAKAEEELAAQAAKEAKEADDL